MAGASFWSGAKAAIIIHSPLPSLHLCSLLFQLSSFILPFLSSAISSSPFCSLNSLHLFFPTFFPFLLSSSLLSFSLIYLNSVTSFFSCCFLCSFCSTSIPSNGCRSSQKVYSSQSTEMSSMQTRQHWTLIKMGGQIQKSAKSLMTLRFMFPILKPSLVKSVHYEFSYTKSKLDCLLKSLCLNPALTCPVFLTLQLFFLYFWVFKPNIAYASLRLFLNMRS